MANELGFWSGIGQWFREKWGEIRGRFNTWWNQPHWWSKKAASAAPADGQITQGVGDQAPAASPPFQTVDGQAAEAQRSRWSSAARETTRSNATTTRALLAAAPAAPGLFESLRCFYEYKDDYRQIIDKFDSETYVFDEVLKNKGSSIDENLANSLFKVFEKLSGLTMESPYIKLDEFMQEVGKLDPNIQQSMIPKLHKQGVEKVTALLDVSSNIGGCIDALFDTETPSLSIQKTNG